MIKDEDLMVIICSQCEMFGGAAHCIEHKCHGMEGKEPYWECLLHDKELCPCAKCEFEYLKKVMNN